VAKAKPGSINYASSGAGTIDHLAGALLASELNIDMVHVPYKGTAPALTDLVAGNTQVMVTTLNTLLPFAKDQRLRPLAIASLKRSKLLPDVPTVAEAAQIPGFEITAWNGIVAPAGTAPEIVGKLNATVNRILARKDFQEKLAAGGAEAYGGTSAAYGEYLRSEMLRWRVVIHRAGVTPQ
jgi:tripartite-type tricarboxylate transporter receptor subunit TctC